MPHSRAFRIQPLLIALAILCLSVGAEARGIHIWQLEEIAAAPVLVVGQVLAVHEGGPPPGEAWVWSKFAVEMTADVRVLRSYGNAGQPVLGNRIRLHFHACCTPATRAILNGPGWPDLIPGQVHVLPLQDNPKPAWDLWELLADEGPDSTLPTRAEMALDWPAPTARAFLLREIANTLSY